MNQLAGTCSFGLLCGYSMGHFYKGTAHTDLGALHTHLVSDTRELATHSPSLYLASRDQRC